jgi:hypothetical protein
MMLLGIDWFVVGDSRRKAAINVLFLCEMVVSLYVVGFCFMYNIHYMWVCIFSSSCFNKPIKKYNTNFVPPPKKKSTLDPKIIHVR